MAKRKVKKVAKRVQKPKPTTKNAGPKDAVQLIAYIPRELHRSLKHEAIERQMTLGAIITEALDNRVWFVKRDGTGQVIEKALGAPHATIEVSEESARVIPNIRGHIVDLPEQQAPAEVKP